MLSTLGSKSLEIPDSINRRRIGYFSTGSHGPGSRQEIERFVQANLAQWGQSYGPGQPYITYNPSYGGRYELEWHRPKTPQEQEAQRTDDRERLRQQYGTYQRLAAQQNAYASQLTQFAGLQAQATSYLQQHSGNQAAGESVSPARRYVGTRVDASVWTRLKVFFIALITGASPFRVYWEMKHALRVRDN